MNLTPTERRAFCALIDGIHELEVAMKNTHEDLHGLCQSIVNRFEENKGTLMKLYGDWYLKPNRKWGRDVKWSELTSVVENNEVLIIKKSTHKIVPKAPIETLADQES